MIPAIAEMQIRIEADPATKTVVSATVLMNEGSSGREAMLITSGTATVRRGGRLIASVGPGDILGEMALLANQNRTATVTAETNLVVEVLNRREFLSLLDEVPAIAKKMLVTAIARLNQLEPSLAG